jgi:hypothetical protein
MLRLPRHKRLLISESHGDPNRCTPYRGNLIHTPHTLLAPVHVCHPYAFRGQSPYVATFHADTIELDRPYCSWVKRAPDTIINTSTDRSAGLPPSSLSNIAIEAVMKAKHLLTNRLHRFTRPISPACDQYIQYLLAGMNTSVLNWHRRGLQPWRCPLDTSHSPTFSSDGPLLST